MADKDAFRRAIYDLRGTLTTLPAETRKVGSNLIRSVERFAGELRQERSALKQDNDLLRRDLGALRKRLDEQIADNTLILGRLRSEIGVLERLLKVASESGIRLPDSGNSGAAFTAIKAKCMACSLHFILCTYSPEKHSAATLHCPECGQNDGGFMVWAESVKGLIYELVPGRSELIEYPDFKSFENARAGNPVPVRRSFTFIPTGTNLNPVIMIQALQELHAQVGRRQGGCLPVGTMTYEDFVKDGEVLFFAFAVNTGEGRSIDGCAVPDPDESREEQVRDLINASPHPGKFALEPRPQG